MRSIGWFAWAAATCLLIAACAGPPDSVPSGNVLERLQSSERVDDADAATCREAVPEALAADGPPPVLATDRATYAEVAEAMSVHGRETLVAVPELSDDAAVTLCWLDTRAMPAAPFGRSILAISGHSSWWAGGRGG